MHWYLVHTKPRQEKCALENLHGQGYQCYLPTLPSEKLRQGLVTVADEPLFPRYLFIRLGIGDTAKSWAPIRSTKGVSRLVSFGIEPARVDDGLIELLRTQEASVQTETERLFKAGRARASDGSTVCGHRRYLPNGRWRASGHGADRDTEQACGRACRTGQFAQGELINVPRYCLFGKKPFSKS